MSHRKLRRRTDQASQTQRYGFTGAIRDTPHISRSPESRDRVCVYVCVCVRVRGV